MEITFFVYEYPPYIVGGLGTYAEYLTRWLVRMGHDVTVFSMHAKNAPTRDVYMGVEVHRPIVENINISLLLPMFIPEEIQRWSEEGRKFFGDVFLYNVLSASKLVNDLVRNESRKVDLIASHDWLGSIGGILSSRGLNKPLVFHVHSTEQGRTGDGSETIKRLERLAAEHASRIITVSYAMRDHLISLGYDEKKIHVVYNGVDSEKYDPGRISPEDVSNVRKSISINEDEYMILFIGRLTWIKGADTLILAMPEILSRVPKAKLVIVGVGEQEELLRDNIQRLRLKDKVILKNEFIPEDLRIKYYAAADVCVFPSKYEPFGIVCTEAMSMGKPVVVGARGVSGMREQVIPSGPNQCGFHINPYDPSDIAKFVITLLQDEDLRRRCGLNARKRVLDEFAWKNVAENTVRVYEEALRQ
ncbi:glycosyltransferase family 4 protein [Candidatus Bathyarchaeota archaeon]|nr:glycosyltransferase family 4 protein [Candidatus Bathyarchaeota archaeon]MBS7613126.1 glycosyltransferase family 4 protein [Candidatus Bathyarchaeota archaeon]MBS7617067.1 glycosyltransferase family 4 protein [Candidatus Bathyarchaeota archaeon]